MVESQVTLNHSYFTEEKLIPVEQLLKAKQYDPQTLELMLKDLSLKSANMEELLKGILHENDPLYKTMRLRLAAYEGGDPSRLSTIYLKTLYHMLLGGVCLAHQKSGEEENSVEFSALKRGNSCLTELMGEKLGSRLHLNHQLKQVSRDSDQTFILTFKEGKKVKADFLVLALPCSVYNEILFDSQTIPAERLLAIKSIQYGTNAKILIPFNSPPAKTTGVINDKMGSFFDPEQNLLTLYYTGQASFFSPDTIKETYFKDLSMLESAFKGSYPSFLYLN